MGLIVRIFIFEDRSQRNKIRSHVKLLRPSLGNRPDTTLCMYLPDEYEGQGVTVVLTANKQAWEAFCTNPDGSYKMFYDGMLLLGLVRVKTGSNAERF